MSQSDEIKSRLDIVEVIRSYVQVKAVGANFQALCPFHREKSPSFVISPEKNIWHCFGCGKGGDIFSFVQEMEGIGFVEAMRLLAPKAGVTLTDYEKNDFSKRNRLLDILESATRYFEKHLESEAGAYFREYLTERGLKEETIKEWRIGFAPDSWDNLILRLKELPKNDRLHFNDQEIFAAGLSVRKEGASHYYNRFRDRIIFPIADINSNVIAFTARINPKSEQNEKAGGKYINSPQTELYDKSRVVFGLDQAKAAIKSEDLAIVVEGQMDVIMAHQHGFKNVVASSGTALTAEQLKIIKRFTNNLALAFDMDAAGQMAADRGIKEAMALDFNINVIILKDGKDAAECLKKHPEEWRQAVNEARPMMEYYLDKLSADFNPKTAVGSKELVKRALEMIAKFSSKIEQDFWLRQVAEIIGVPEQSLRDELKKNSSAVVNHQATESEEKSTPKEQLDRHELMSELTIALVLRLPSLIPYLATKLEPEFLKGNGKISFYKDLIIYYNKTGIFSYEDFRSFLLAKGEKQENLLDLLVLLGEKDFYSLSEIEIKNEIGKSIAELKKYYYQERIKSIQRELPEAERKGQEELVQKLMNDLKDFTDRLREVNVVSS